MKRLSEYQVTKKCLPAPYHVRFIFDFLVDSIDNLGATAIGAGHEVKRGATFDHKTIVVNERPHNAIKTLQRNGVDAWAGRPLRRGRGEFDVIKCDYERAKSILQRNGYDCW